MHLIIWEFQVRSGSQRRFESLYGPGGAWGSLFSRDPGWLGTELLRDNDMSDRYLTIDRWRSAQDYERFLASTGVEYRQIDRAGEGMTVVERLVGRFEVDTLA